MSNRRLTIIVFCIWISGDLLGSALVTTYKRRTVLLETIEQAVRAKPTEYPALPVERPSPFSAWRTPKEVVRKETSIDTGVAVVEPEAVRLSDEVALPIIAANFNASGSLITSSRRMIRLKEGTLVSEGSTFNVRIGEETYSVLVSKVDSDFYILTLGKVSMTRSFGSSELKNGSINRGGIR